jgi:signal transduction histidine kinase
MSHDISNLRGFIVDGVDHDEVPVEDNGPGVPDGMKGKIFNRLQRGNTKARGMGLGLYIARALVESYGGSVEAEDRVPGDHTKGAKFLVYLPAENGHVGE